MDDDRVVDEAVIEEEARYLPTVERVYRSDAIEVLWEPSLCIHVGTCFRGLPEVFDPRARPWVNIEGASPEEIAAVVEQCPSGALHYRRRDGGPQEEAGSEVTVQPRTNGPLLLRGPIEVIDVQGNVVRTDTRLALCRCGASENKPYCDGSH
ncbi:MAG: (4Fe-4S)-binding protein, partial [Dehalococcoidia bacterium]|nr:(4Fe-4S)-binding protein [Dehalococcoidia bacterium]